MLGTQREEQGETVFDRYADWSTKQLHILVVGYCRLYHEFAFDGTRLQAHTLESDIIAHPIDTFEVLQRPGALVYKKPQTSLTRYVFPMLPARHMLPHVAYTIREDGSCMIIRNSRRRRE